MKNQFLTALIATITAAASSCGPMSNQNATVAGGAAGVVGGAALGGLIGHQSGRAGEGVALGAVAGGLAGAQNGPKWFGGDETIEKTERE